VSLKPLAMADIAGDSFLPQAIIKHSVEGLWRHLIALSLDPAVDLRSGHDDFDDYIGAAFALNGNLPFTIKHYQGHPTDTFTVYLPPGIREVPEITVVISSIVGELRLENDLIWQRADDPDL
jgi:hypothetical protein